MTTFPHVRVFGPAFERGRQYGAAARDRVARSLAAYRAVFHARCGWDWPTVLGEARRYAEPIEAFRPAILEEMAGLAAGAGVERDDILALNVRTEVMFAATARDARRQTQDGCSAFAVLPRRSADGHTLVGQNWDWLPHAFETVVVLEAEPDDGPPFVTVVEAGLLAKAGMNACGLGVATNALVTDQDRGVPGVPYHVLLRALLGAATVPEALACIQAERRSSSANYLLAHRDGVALDVEAAPGGYDDVHVLLPEGGICLHTNHFLAPGFRGTDVSLWAMPDSPTRLVRLQEAVLEAGPRCSLDTFRAVLRDHACHPFSVCAHPDPRAAEVDQGATVASVLMDLDAGLLWLADGPPCTARYRRLDYAAFLGAGAPPREPAALAR